MTEIEGAFVFGVTLIRDNSGGIHIDTHVLRENIPDEFVIMKLRAHLKTLETDYFKNYNENNPN